LGQLYELMTAKEYTETDLVWHKGKYFSWQHHSKFSGEELPSTLAGINLALAQAHSIFGNLKHLQLTFGTAWVYQLIADHRIVANCHKFPSQAFEKEILTVNQIVEAYASFFEQYFSSNPDVKVVLTLSPVRHVRDGLVEDRLSKSVLRVAIEALVGRFSNVYYFPSYESITDDLRDYRFFKDDLVHPTDFAIEYVWAQYVEAFFDNKTRAINQEIEAIQKRLQHKGHLQDRNFVQFKETTFAQIDTLQKKYPFLTFD
jgi:hypothetical protein